MLELMSPQHLCDLWSFTGFLPQITSTEVNFHLTEVAVQGFLEKKLG